MSTGERPDLWPILHLRRDSTQPLATAADSWFVSRRRRRYVVSCMLYGGLAVQNVVQVQR